MALSFEKLHPAIGARVTGIDLAEPLDEATRSALRDALLTHHLLLFPLQRFSDRQQIAFTRNFGDLEIFPQQDNRGSGLREIFRLANVGEDGKILPVTNETARFLGTTQFWHTDSSYRAIPSKGAVLHGIEIPPEGGDTLFVNCFAVYEALPDSLRARVEGKSARNDYLYMRTSCDLPPMKPEEAATVPPVEHRLVRTHAGGRRSLYISPVYVNSITGLNFEETRALVDELTEFATRPEFTYRHIWTANDVLMWDNRCTMHRVMPYDSANQRRIMHRTTVAGEAPVS